MKYKEKEKLWLSKIKENKSKDWKFKGWFIFKNLNEFFFSSSFYVSLKENKISGYLGYKPMNIDNIFWDIIDEQISSIPFARKTLLSTKPFFPLIRLISIIKFLRIFPRFSVSVILPRKYRKGCLIQTILFEPTGKTSLKPNAEIPSALQTSL